MRRHFLCQGAQPGVDQAKQDPEDAVVWQMLGRDVVTVAADLGLKESGERTKPNNVPLRLHIAALFSLHSLQK